MYLCSMDIESLRLFCLGLPGVTEDFPFDESTLAFRVGGKIFGLLSTDTGDSINLKNDPDKNIELRETYPEYILPGYHMNKTHWNTVKFNRLSIAKVQELLQDSYQIVRASLPKKVQAELS